MKSASSYYSYEKQFQVWIAFHFPVPVKELLLLKGCIRNKHLNIKKKKCYWGDWAAHSLNSLKRLNGFSFNRLVNFQELKDVTLQVKSHRFWHEIRVKLSSTTSPSSKIHREQKKLKLQELLYYKGQLYSLSSTFGLVVSIMIIILQTHF